MIILLKQKIYEPHAGTKCEILLQVRPIDQLYNQ